MSNARVRLTSVLAGCALAATIGLIPSSPAQAEPEIKNVQARVDTLYHEAEQASERYNDARHLDPGDQGSGMIRMPEPATRIAIIAAAPEEPDDRELTDAILAGLGIPMFFAPEETLEEPLASSLMAEPIEPTEAMTEQLRVDYEDSSVGLVVRPEAARRMVERLAGLREGGLSPMTHGAVAQLRLSEKGAELHSYGVRPALR